MVLDAWHVSKVAQEIRDDRNPSVRMALKLRAEAAAISRFG